MILNVGSGKSVKLMEIISIIQTNYNHKNFYFNKSAPKMIPVRKISIDKLKKFVNLKNFNSLKNGLEKTIKWYKKNN